MNIDIIIALGIFLTTVIFIILLVFSNFQTQLEAKQKENLKFKAIEILENIKSQKELIDKAFRIPIIIYEPNFDNRENEPVEIILKLDENCEINVTENSLFLSNENLNETPFNKTIVDYCYGIFLKSIKIIFNVDIQRNTSRLFYLYFSNKNFTEKNYSIIINTSSFVPKDGDSYTETLSNWNRVGGISASPSLSSIRKVGSYSVEISDFPSNSLGLELNETPYFQNVNNNWYLRVWLFLNSSQNISQANLTLIDANEKLIYKNLDSSLLTNWYLFEEEINSTNWNNWDSFNPTTIKSFRFIVYNSSISNALNLKVDGLRFEKKPLITKTLPIEILEVFDSEKLKELSKENYELLKQTFGERFFIEIEK